MENRICNACLKSKVLKSFRKNKSGVAKRCDRCVKDKKYPHSLIAKEGFKICSGECGLEKSIEEFSKRNDTSSGRKGVCKSCISKRSHIKKYGCEKPEKDFIIQGFKKCTVCSEVKSFDDFYKNNTTTDKKDYRCKLCLSIYRHKTKNQSKERRKLNREKQNISQRAYNNKNRDRVRAKKRFYQIKRLSEDTLYKLKHSISSLIKDKLNRSSVDKNGKTSNILGCSIEEFKQHIESQFLPWMSWENQGRYTGEYSITWQLDHIIPTSVAKTEEEIYRLNHYSNFQPLCSKINTVDKREKIYPCSNVLSKITYI